MKKVLNYVPHIIFAGAFIVLGAIGKLTGTAAAVDMFTQIDFLGMGEQFGRLTVGLGQLFAGIGIFFKPTRKIAAVLGIAIMAGAIFYSVTLFNMPVITPIIVMILGIYLLFKGGCAGCAKGKCEGGVCKA